MHNLGGLAVDRPRRTHDRGAERCCDRLMAQAAPQQRSGGAAHAHDIYADARVSRAPGPGEITMPAGAKAAT